MDTGSGSCYNSSQVITDHTTTEGGGILGGKNNSGQVTSNPVQKLHNSKGREKNTRIRRTIERYRKDQRTNEEKVDDFISCSPDEQKDLVIEQLEWFFTLLPSKREDIKRALNLSRNYWDNGIRKPISALQRAGLSPWNQASHERQLLTQYKQLLDGTEAKINLFDRLIHADLQEVQHIRSEQKELEARTLQDHVNFLPDIIHAMWKDRAILLEIRYLIEQEVDGVYTCDVYISMPDWTKITFSLNDAQFLWESRSIPGSDDWCCELWDDPIEWHLHQEIEDKLTYYNSNPYTPYAKLNCQLLCDLSARLTDGPSDRLNWLDPVELKPADPATLALLLGTLLLDGRDEEAMQAREDPMLARRLCREYSLTED